MYTNNKKELRYERKFIIPCNEKNYIRHFLYSNELRFYKHYKQRRVNSIYLDYPQYKFLFENIEGLKIRQKIRIRWYGDGEKVTIPKLEIKHKNNNLGYKSLYVLNKFNLNETKSIMKNIRNYILKSKNNISLIEDLKNIYPTLYVSYIRNYYKSKLIDCRITLDEKIIFKKLNIRSNFKLKSHNVNNSMIMEIKYPNNLNKDYLSSFLKIPFRLSKNSKYTSGMSNFLNF